MLKIALAAIIVLCASLRTPCAPPKPLNLLLPTSSAWNNFKSNSASLLNHSKRTLAIKSSSTQSATAWPPLPHCAASKLTSFSPALPSTSLSKSKPRLIQSLASHVLTTSRPSSSWPITVPKDYGPQRPKSCRWRHRLYLKPPWPHAGNG